MFTDRAVFADLEVLADPDEFAEREEFSDRHEFADLGMFANRAEFKNRLEFADRAVLAERAEFADRAVFVDRVVFADQDEFDDRDEFGNREEILGDRLDIEDLFGESGKLLDDCECTLDCLEVFGDFRAVEFDRRVVLVIDGDDDRGVYATARSGVVKGRVAIAVVGVISDRGGVFDNRPVSASLCAEA